MYPYLVSYMEFPQLSMIESIHVEISTVLESKENQIHILNKFCIALNRFSVESHEKA